MTYTIQLIVHDDGTVTAVVGTAKNRFTGGSEKENLRNAAEWVDSLVYSLEGDECG